MTFNFLKEHIGDIFRLSFRFDRSYQTDGWIIITTLTKIKDGEAFFKPVSLEKRGGLSDHSIEHMFDEDTYIRYENEENFIDVEYIGKFEDYPEYFI